MADDVDEQPLDGMEIIALRATFDLVPEWTNTLERIATHHGARVVLGVDGEAMVVKVALLPARREHFLAEVQRYWEQFVERRKREGRWQPT
ncbi:MAG: hypothetical protein R3F59_37210 [Myxococcota bacterium]